MTAAQAHLENLIFHLDSTVAAGSSNGIGANVRFAPKATELARGRNMSRRPTGDIRNEPPTKAALLFGSPTTQEKDPPCLALGPALLLDVG
jgi:hypothetical protein